MVPATAPPMGRILACADDTRVVAEAREANNCRTTPDHDRDRYSSFGDCAPRNRNINPGVNDRPDVPGFRDTNCDGIDGIARRAIFVSPVGDDANPGTRAKPKRTLTAGGRQSSGPRQSRLRRVRRLRGTVDLATGVGVYGGYKRNWKRSLSVVTSVAGAPEGVRAANATGVVLQLLSVRASNGGGSTYGIRAVDGSSIMLQRVTVAAGDAADGRAGVNGVTPPGGNGSPGLPGGNGNCDGDPFDRRWAAPGETARSSEPAARAATAAKTAMQADRGTRVPLELPAARAAQAATTAGARTAGPADPARPGPVARRGTAAPTGLRALRTSGSATTEASETSAPRVRGEAAEAARVVPS